MGVVCVGVWVCGAPCWGFKTYVNTPFVRRRRMLSFEGVLGFSQLPSSLPRCAERGVAKRKSVTGARRLLGPLGNRSCSCSFDFGPLLGAKSLGILQRYAALSMFSKSCQKCCFYEQELDQEGALKKKVFGSFDTFPSTPGLGETMECFFHPGGQKWCPQRRRLLACARS